VSWDFETEPEFQKQLDWIEKFVHEEVEPLDAGLEDLFIDYTAPLSGRK